jgi:hypothetical protein
VLKPQLPENLAAFERFARWKLASVPVVVCALIAGVFILPTRALPWLAAALLALVFLFLAYCEIQKTRIFAKDLRERRVP